MTHQNHDHVVILADESANWKIGGLRQLDRLILAFNEFAETAACQKEMAVDILWAPNIPVGERWSPNSTGLVCIRSMRPELLDSSACFLTTRLFVARNGLAEFLRNAPKLKLNLSAELPADNWRKLSSQLNHIDYKEEGWRILEKRADLGAAEWYLLRRSGKKEDGFVSRFINRPVSRLVTRGLLRLPITPNTCTLAMLVVPLVSLLFLVRGDYLGFVAGTAFFHLANILDGCDGEIARAKYLESERGLRLDAFCDLVTNLLFILCLSIGLYREPDASANLRTVYLFEGVLAVTLLVARAASYAAGLVSIDTTRQLDRRDGQAVLNSSQHLFGEKITTCLIQVTKRDVIFLAFFVLALLGYPACILHITFAFSVVTLFLRVKNAGILQRETY